MHQDMNEITFLIIWDLIYNMCGFNKDATDASINKEITNSWGILLNETTLELASWDPQCQRAFPATAPYFGRSGFTLLGSPYVLGFNVNHKMQQDLVKLFWVVSLF